MENKNSRAYQLSKRIAEMKGNTPLVSEIFENGKKTIIDVFKELFDFELNECYLNHFNAHKPCFHQDFDVKQNPTNIYGWSADHLYINDMYFNDIDFLSNDYDGFRLLKTICDGQYDYEKNHSLYDILVKKDHYGKTRISYILEDEKNRDSNLVNIMEFVAAFEYHLLFYKEAEPYTREELNQLKLPHDVKDYFVQQ